MVRFRKADRDFRIAIGLNIFNMVMALVTSIIQTRRIIRVINKTYIGIIKNLGDRE